MKISAQAFQERKTNYLQEIQSTFIGGMNLQLDPSAIEDSEYVVGFNCTNRYGKVKPVKGFVELGQTLVGIKQGIYSIGPFFITFVAGKAYYRTNSNDLYLIEDFQMSDTAARLYVAFVPASTINMQRYLDTATDNTSLLINPAVLVNVTPAALIVQDGLTQPWIIYLDGSTVRARKTQTYEDWSLETNRREYVPIGCDMLFMDGILFINSADRTKLYRSVTGRPLDFVVNVDTNGNKGGDANTTAYAVSYNLNLALSPLSSNSFMVSTDAPMSFQITINRDKTIFGEPTFNRGDLFNAALINSFSSVDLLGDTALITHKGIRSFNATLQLKIESRNALFSGKINKAFELNDSEDIIQDTYCAAVEFRDFCLFSVETLYGNAIALYDRINKVWPGFILLPTGAKFKQFASLMPNVNRIYGITTDDRIYELFAGDYMNAFIYTKEFCIDNPQYEQKIHDLRVNIDQQPSLGTINATGYCDNVAVMTESKSLEAEIPTNDYSTEFPYNRGLSGNKNSMAFMFKQDVKRAWKIAYGIRWTNGGELHTIIHNSEIVTPTINQTQQKKS